MKIGIGKRQLQVTIEKAPVEIPEEAAMIGADDRDIERIARSASTRREPRWDVGPALFGGYRL